MISPFSRLMDRAVEAHFRIDPGGRLVFIPFSLKKTCYFVDSKSEHDKLRAFVKMYRSAIGLISLLASPSIYVAALILDDFGGMSPRGRRLAISLGVPLFFWLVLVALMLMLWGLYKQALPSFTASLTEVQADLKGQLSEISPRPRRLAQVCVAAGMALLALAVLLMIQHRPRRTGTCPPQEHACQQLEVDSAHQSRPQS